MTWIPLGPSCTALDPKLQRAPVTGTVTCIAFDPVVAGTIYIGTAGGGVWRTSDAGLHWQPLTDHTMSLAVGAIAIGPRTGRIYAGTGDGTRPLRFPMSGALVLKGRGLLTSDDRGSTWDLHTGFFDVVPPPPPPSFPPTPREPPYTVEDAHVGARIHQIVVFPDDDMHVAIATSHGLFESTDGGHNWDRHTLGDPRYAITSTVLDDSDPAGPTLYASVAGTTVANAHRGIWQRRGTGAWQRLQAPLGTPARITLAISPTTVETPQGPRRIVYVAATDDIIGQIESIQRTRDGGATWEDLEDDFRTVGSNRNSGVSVPTLVVDPEQPESIYLGGISVFRRKHAAAPKWELLGSGHEDSLHAHQFALAFDPHVVTGSPPTLWVGNAGGIWCSRDKGDVWEHRNRGLQIAQLYSLAQYPTADVLLSGSQDNGAQRFIGHPLWRKADNRHADPTNESLSAFDTAIDPTRPGHWYYGTGSRNIPALLLQASQDGGENFYDIGPSAPQESPFYRRFVIDPGPATAERARVVLAGMKAILVSTNEKDGWTTLVADALEVDNHTPVRTDYVSAMTVRGGSLYLGLSFGHYTERDLAVGRIQHRWQLKRIIHPRPAGAPFPPALSEMEETNEVISSIALSEDRQTVLLGIGGKRDMPVPERTPLVSDGIELSRVMKSFAGGVGSDLPFPLHFPDAPAFLTRGPLTIDGLWYFENPVNAIAFDPLVPTRVFVGCDVGVFRSDDNGEHFVEWRRGLPNALVTDIEIEAQTVPGRPRLVRISTYGRGVWERSIEATDEDTTPARPDIYLRLHSGFTRRPEPAEPAKPASHERQIWRDQADLRIQRKRKDEYPKVRSTETYTPEGQLDYLGFEVLPRKIPKRATESKLHVQVHNRGPAIADAVEVRLFWAPKSGTGYPALPANFWTGTIGMPMNTNVWKPIGDVVVVDRIAPADPRVATFEWMVPDDPPERIALLAVVTCADDPIVEPATSPLDVEALARQDKRVLLTSTKVTGGSDHSSITAGDVLQAIAVVAVASVVVYGTYRAIEDS